MYQTNLGRMETEGEKAFKFAEAINKTIALVHIKSTFYDFVIRTLMRSLCTTESQTNTETSPQTQTPQQPHKMQALGGLPRNVSEQNLRRQNSQQTLVSHSSSASTSSQLGLQFDYLNEFFFKKSDNSVILFKVSFLDGYCK